MIKIFTDAKFETLSKNDLQADIYYGELAAQNRWDESMKWKEGRILIPSEVFEFFKDSTDVVIKLSLRRKNSSHGLSRTVKPAISGMKFEVGATRGQWTSDAIVPISIFGPDGTVIRLYDGTQGEEGYAIWDAMRLTVILKEV